MRDSVVTKATGTQALERAMRLMDAIAATPHGARLAELAAACGLEQPTAHRIVMALERSGFVGRVGDTRRLCLGPKLFQLASAGAEGAGLVEAARPALVRLAAATGDCVFLMVRSGLDAICLDRQDGGYTIHSLTGHVGGATPLGLGTGSMLLLSYLPAAERTEVIAANRKRIEALAHRVPTETDAAAIRARGYSYEVSGSVAGIAGVAVPVLTPKGRALAALSVGATEARLPASRLDEILAVMGQEAGRIETAAAHTREAFRAL